MLHLDMGSRVEKGNKIFLISVHDFNMNPLCKYCGATATKKCGGCKSVYYCSKFCQKYDRKDHKPFCELVSSRGMVPNILYPDDVVVVGHQMGALIYSPKRKFNLHLVPKSKGIFCVSVHDNQAIFHDNFADKYHSKENEDVKRLFRCKNCGQTFASFEEIMHDVRHQKCPHPFCMK